MISMYDIDQVDHSWSPQYLARCLRYNWQLLSKLIYGHIPSESNCLPCPKCSVPFRTLCPYTHCFEHLFLPTLPHPIPLSTRWTPTYPSGPRWQVTSSFLPSWIPLDHIHLCSHPTLLIIPIPMLPGCLVICNVCLYVNLPLSTVSSWRAIIDPPAPGACIVLTNMRHLIGKDGIPQRVPRLSPVSRRQ